MSKKILICEDMESISSSLNRVFTGTDITPVLLLREYSDLVVADVEQVVKEEQPDYMSVDGLNGRWSDVINIARNVKSDIVSVVFSGDDSIVNEARERGYKAFNKIDGFDKMRDYFVGLAGTERQP